jgi:PTS system galactitol-specific IIB component
MAHRFRILLLCGTGIATSTVVRLKVEQALRAEGLAAAVDLRQGKVADVLASGADADLVVATAQVPPSVTVPVINGIALITGIGAQSVLSQIVDAARSGVSAHATSH